MFSVVVPLYNKEKEIIKTIESVLSQSFQDFELIIVNDGSTDESLTKVRQINDTRIQIIDRLNKGVSSARNCGIHAAKYMNVALLDADDIWDSDYLAEMSTFIQAYPDAALYGCGYSFQNHESEYSTPHLGLPINYKGYIDYFKYAGNNTLFTSSSVIIRKDDFLDVGEFDISLTRGEDIDLWIRFALFKKVAFYNKPLMVYSFDSEKRSSQKPPPRQQCLIWNLERYASQERSNPLFKEFLENWRLAHINNYLTGLSVEVTEIRSLLRNVNIKNRSILWKILKYSPQRLHKIIYRLWIFLKSSQKGNN